MSDTDLVHWSTLFECPTFEEPDATVPTASAGTRGKDMLSETNSA